MGNKDRLKFHVRIQPHAIEEISKERLVGVVMQTPAEHIKVEVGLERGVKVGYLTAPVVLGLGRRAAVPHSPTGPLEELGLANRERSRPITMKRAGIKTHGECVPDALKIL
jgi:hypothetical protein